MEVSKSDKDKDDKKKVTFSKRLCAYLIDILIVSMVAGLISGFFLDSDKILETNKRLENITNEIATSYELDTLKYEKYIDVCYDMARYQGVILLVELVLVILYYVVYQIYNDGQTIGKKLLKIKVVSRNDELTMNQMIFRSCLSTTLLIDLISLILLSFSSKYAYFYGVVIFELTFYIITLVSIFMVMFGKSGLAIHDKWFKTEVVEVN